MPELLGHLAMGLLFAFPAWMLWDGRTAAGFIGFVMATSKLPDVDILLKELGLPFHHHGVTHTLAFVLVFSVVVGAIGVVLFRPVIKRWCGLTEGETVHTGTVYLFVTGGLVLGGVSHVFADMLADDGYQKIEPFWPVVQETYSIHVAHFTSPWLNLWLLVVAATLHALVVASGIFPLEHPFRYWTRQLAVNDEDRDSAERSPEARKARSEDT